MCIISISRKETKNAAVSSTLYYCRARFQFWRNRACDGSGPALSIVREFKTSGPVTETLIPMAALDDIVGCVIFFSTIAIVAGNLSAGELPAYMIALVVVLPLVIGVVVGLLAGLVLKKERSTPVTMVLLIVMIVAASGVGFWFNNYVMPSPVLNFMLIGMAFSATFSNMVSEQRLEQIMGGFNPFLHSGRLLSFRKLQ